MVKIVVFEDDGSDLSFRYNDLRDDHDIAVYFQGTAFGRTLLEEEGWTNLHKLFDDSVPNDADLYFSDGLQGSWRYALEDVPKEKAYVVSGEPDIQEEARTEGFNVINEMDIGRVVQELMESQR